MLHGIMLYPIHTSVQWGLRIWTNVFNCTGAYSVHTKRFTSWSLYKVSGISTSTRIPTDILVRIPQVLIRHLSNDLQTLLSKAHLNQHRSKLQHHCTSTDERDTEYPANVTIPRTFFGQDWKHHIIGCHSCHYNSHSIYWHHTDLYEYVQTSL